MKMKHLSASLLGAALVAGCMNNNSNSDSKGPQAGADAKPVAASKETTAKETTAKETTAKETTAKETTAAGASAAAKAVEYSEVPAKGRIYVLASKSSADKAAAGEMPEVTATKIGYGPNGETVVFEANKDKVEDQLVAEYDKRHAPK